MDYYKNIDHFPCESKPLQAVGVQYDEIVPLAGGLIDLNEFKEHERIDFDTDDTLCQMYIDSAIQELQDWAQISFGVRTMRLRAKSLPDGYRIMYGRVDSIIGSEYTNTGDILDKGGRDVDFTYTTLGIFNTAIKVAIMRYAGNLYINRETINESKYIAQTGMDEAKAMLRPFINITL